MAIITHDCPHCHTKRVAFDIVQQNAVPSGGGREWNVFVVCNGCGVGAVAFVISRTGLDPVTHVDTEPDKFTVQHFWPEPEGPESPDHLPPNIEAFYLQAAENVGRNFDAAGAMFRKALDVTLKIICPEATGKLANRINKAVKLGKLTESLGEWAHKIRIGGNDAVHDEDPYTEDEARDLHRFTELVLMYVFTLPGMMAERREKATQEQSEGTEAADN